ncbi:hypothetical protein VI817_005926 [Penicillium citrinum]|nr:hypothetical protein VI817_005926 [Penicillium citrinum]
MHASKSDSVRSKHRQVVTSKMKSSSPIIAGLDCDGRLETYLLNGTPVFALCMDMMGAASLDPADLCP